jgi:glycine cleavage system H protein
LADQQARQSFFTTNVEAPAMMYVAKNSPTRILERLDKYRKIVPDGEAPCVWAEAGVVPFKLCDYHFDCNNCAFDMVMRRSNELTPSRVDSRGGELCPHCFYHQCHTWAKVEEKAFVRIGIDDFGQHILGLIEKISLPIKDEKLGKKSIRVKGRGSIIPLNPPVDGYVVEVNEELVNHPELVNTSPYEKGWIVLLRPSSLVKNLKKLFFGPAAIQWFDLEMYRLAALITAQISHGAGDELGMTLPDGGLPDFGALDKLPPVMTKRILEQCFLYAHTNDEFKT